MRKIGFTGGSSIYELGPSSDVVLFFDCLKTYVEQEEPNRDWSLLTDRLYRRYLRLDELDRASVLMEQAQQIFAQHSAASSAEWDALLAGEPERSWLDPNQSTLADVFSKYFDGFAHCVESARLNYEAFKSYPGYTYEPVRTVISDLPGYARDKKKPLVEYDALEGEPFWLR